MSQGVEDDVIVIPLSPPDTDPGDSHDTLLVDIPFHQPEQENLIVPAISIQQETTSVLPFHQRPSTWQITNPNLPALPTDGDTVLRSGIQQMQERLESLAQTFLSSQRVEVHVYKLSIYFCSHRNLGTNFYFISVTFVYDSLLPGNVSRYKP